MRQFLESPDAAHVLELMREAELTALELTEAVPWPGRGVVSLMLLMPPVRLVLRTEHQENLDFLAVDVPLPAEVLRQLSAGLQRDALWRRVRRAVDVRLRTA